jgi:hypothetical protein
MTQRCSPVTAERATTYRVVTDGPYFGIEMNDGEERTVIEFGIKKYERALKRAQHWRDQEANARRRSRSPNTVQGE